MRVEPQHAQLPALLATVARDGADRADAQRVIAPEQDRQPSGAQLPIDGLVYQLAPAYHLGQMSVAMLRRLPGVARPVEIAEVDDFELALTQRTPEPGDAQRLGSHRGAAIRRAHIGR